MFGASLRLVSVVLATTAMTACSTDGNTMRFASSVQVPQTANLSVLAREFQAQTPYVVYFGFDEDWLDAEATARLDEQAEWIAAHPDVTFRVYGHADRVGSTEYNMGLGLRRAQNAVAYLVSKGIDEDRLEAMVSFGEDAPEIDTEARERLNRRVVTEVFGVKRPTSSSSSSAAFDGPSTATPMRGGDGTSRIISISTTSDGPTGSEPTFDTGPSPTSDPSPSTGSTSTSDPSPDSGSSSSSEPSGDSSPSSDPEPSPEPSTSTDSGKNPNSGRGNGDEAGDPGKSGGKNKGGDEV